MEEFYVPREQGAYLDVINFGEMKKNINDFASNAIIHSILKFLLSFINFAFFLEYQFQESFCTLLNKTLKASNVFGQRWWVRIC